MDREALISKLHAKLADTGPELVAAWLYGSFARGTQRKDSDVDLALLFREPPGVELYRRSRPTSS
jgi:predicted nucleotidyltransferase